MSSEAVGSSTHYKPMLHLQRLPILARNVQRAAASDRAQLKLLPAYLVAELSLGPGRALRPLASLPELLPDYQSCIDDHITNRVRLFQKMKEKRKALLLFQAYLALDYREKFDQYSSHLRGTVLARSQSGCHDARCQGVAIPCNGYSCKLLFLLSACHNAPQHQTSARKEGASAAQQGCSDLGCRATLAIPIL